MSLGHLLTEEILPTTISSAAELGDKSNSFSSGSVSYISAGLKKPSSHSRLPLTHNPISVLKSSPPISSPCHLYKARKSPCCGCISPVHVVTSHLDQCRTGNTHGNPRLTETCKSHSFAYSTQRNIISSVQNGWNWSINSETIRGRLRDWQTKGEGAHDYEFLSSWETRLKIAIDWKSTKLWDALKRSVCSITEAKVGGEILLKNCSEKKFMKGKSVLAIIYLFPGLRKNIIAFQFNCKEKRVRHSLSLIT